MKKLTQKGFTLIELLVVIAIIGILSAVVLVSLNSARAKSRDARRLSDVRQIMTALEIYYNDNGAYPDDNYAAGTACIPSSGGAGVANMCPAPTSTGPTGTATTEWQDFLATWPTSPAPADGTCLNGAAGASGTNDYIYTGVPGAADPSSYTVTFCLGAATGGYAAGVRTASPTGIN
jgi:prepilin-type N-terminal cleavage/methylation domain-containing protein